MKSKLILSPIDKATRINAQVVVITKGFPDETLKNMRQFAVSRNVILLTENNYKEELQTLLVKGSTHEIITRARRQLMRTRGQLSRFNLKSKIDLQNNNL